MSAGRGRRGAGAALEEADVLASASMPIHGFARRCAFMRSPAWRPRAEPLITAEW